LHSTTSRTHTWALRRIVGLTADTTSRVTKACRDAGMSDVLFKPTTASAMMLFLSSVVRSPEPSQSCSEQAPAHTGAAVPLPKTEVRPSIVATAIAYCYCARYIIKYKHIIVYCSGIVYITSCIMLHAAPLQ
jgi:hypothetical protein